MWSCGDLVWMFSTSEENRGVGLAVILGKKTYETRILMTPLRALQGLWKSFKEQFHTVLSPRTKTTAYRADPTKFASSLCVRESNKNALLCEVSIKGVREVGQWCKVLILRIQIKRGHAPWRGGRRQKRGWRTKQRYVTYSGIFIFFFIWKSEKIGPLGATGLSSFPPDDFSNNSFSHVLSLSVRMDAHGFRGNTVLT